MAQESALAWYKKVFAWKEPQTKVCFLECSYTLHSTNRFNLQLSFATSTYLMKIPHPYVLQ